jgi:hypothetical protein
MTRYIANGEGQREMTQEEEREFEADIARNQQVEKPVSASQILNQLSAEEAEKLVDVLVLREVLTPERAEKLKGKKSL